MHYRAAFFMAMFTACNIIIFFKLFNINLLENNKFLVIGTLLGWIFVNFQYFIQPKRHRNIVTRFKNEPIVFKIIGSFLVLAYSIGSFVLFIKIMAS